MINQIFKPLAAGAALLALTAIGAAPAATPSNQRKTTMTMQEDLAHRASAIHWPEGYSPDTADLFSHNALHMNASCERVWSHIVAATKWPEWYPNSKDVRLTDGGAELKAGSVFRWSTFGLPLESRVNEFVPYSRIGWYG